ncbi:MAG: hypothetical protein ABJ308_10115 [Halieaceae bacterium]
MTKYLVALCALVFSSQSLAGAPASDPEAWYRGGYAVLWADKPGQQVEAMLNHYYDTVETHSADGSISRDAKRDWLVPSLKQWLAEGWVSAELKQLKVDRINASTTSFKASWIDHYKETPDEISCGWYLADMIDGRWQFTAYADLDCAAHGL